MRAFLIALGTKLLHIIKNHCHPEYADMAQLVERRTRNAQGVGSSPTVSFKSI